MRSLPILLAVDFDLTIANTNPFPTINGFRRGAKKYLNKLHQEGYYIIIWTCRTDKDQCKDATHARNFLAYNGVKFDLFNDNHIALTRAFGNDSRKVSADFYIDDKGLWLFGIPSWFWLYWIIKFKSWRFPEYKKILSHCKSVHFR